MVEREEKGDGWAALSEGRWQEARHHFAEKVAREGSPEAFEGLSWAAWWLDDADTLFDAREQAFRRYREAGELACASRMATWLASDHLDFRGAIAVASGWIDRAGRLLEPLEPGPDHGWHAFHKGFLESIQGKTLEAEGLGARAAEIGRRFAVPDLEMLGLSLQGMSLVSRAEVADGMRCLDEASAIALAGEAMVPISGAWTCCFLVTSCTRLYDFERAFEWCDQIAAFADRYGSRYMLGFCQAEYATIHLWRGDWDAAERALETSIEALAGSRAPMVGWPQVGLAELRRRRGDAAECERLLEEAGGSTAANLCRAELALDAGAPARAAELVERAARGLSPERPLEEIPALAVLVRAQLACGRIEEAAAALDRFAELARIADTTALAATETLLRGMLAAARGDHQAARPLLEDAVDGFNRCGARFDAACARRELAATLAGLGRIDEGRREAEAACDCLRELGATVELARAERAAGAAAAAPPLPISRREKDVLALLTEGLTNREIAERLFISEHTVHRHVTSILRKLEVPSRAAAAAIAVRAGLSTRP